jgi:Leucine-rich repeat (LRR) protein
LSGPIPHELGKLKKFQDLFAANNQLAGPLPKELGDLPNFNQMDIGHNKITGPIPSNYGPFSPDIPDPVDFTNNMLTGTLNSGHIQTSLISNCKISLDYFAGFL